MSPVDVSHVYGGAVGKALNLIKKVLFDRLIVWQTMRYRKASVRDDYKKNYVNPIVLRTSILRWRYVFVFQGESYKRASKCH